MERCQKGDVLQLTHDARANTLRYCDFNRPVQFLSTGDAICTFAGGVRERRLGGRNRMLPHAAPISHPLQ